MLMIEIEPKFRNSFVYSFVTRDFEKKDTEFRKGGLIWEVDCEFIFRSQAYRDFREQR